MGGGGARLGGVAIMGCGTHGMKIIVDECLLLTINTVFLVILQCCRKLEFKKKGIQPVPYVYLIKL